MYAKKLYSVSLNELGELTKPLAIAPPLQSKKVIGILVGDREINADLYTAIDRLEIPYILIIDLSAKSFEENLTGSATNIADRILPLLMNPMQYQYFFKRVLLLRIPHKEFEKISEWNTLLLTKLNELGIKNVNIGYAPENSKIFEPLETHKSSYSNEPDVLSIKWEIVLNDIVPDSQDFFLGHETIQKNPTEDILLQLKEENASLRRVNDTLLKNIYDLNNYYRFVRGETTFKHHNRDQEEKESGNIIGEISDQKKIAEIKKHYYNVYDSLPGWYKRLGTILKILLWKKELWFYISKKHKKMFLDVLYSLPDEKQLRTWYYYEYEVLPGWYKKVGKLIAHA